MRNMLRFCLFSAVLIGVSPIAGCGRKPAEADSKGKDAAPVFSTVKPERKTLERTIEQPAHVEAYEETPLVVRIAGYIQKINVDIGSKVKGPRYDTAGNVVTPGDVLAELWVPEMEQEYAQKKALVAQADAEVKQAKAALDAAEAHVGTATAAIKEMEAAVKRADANHKRWGSEYQRFQLMAKNQVVDPQTLAETQYQLEASAAAKDESLAKVQSAKASAKEAEAKRDKAAADLVAAKARVEVAAAEAARVDALRQYKYLRAPFDGKVTRRTVHTGHYLQPSASVTMPPFVVAQTDKVRVVSEIPEGEAAYVRDGMPATVRVQTLNNREFPGKVTRTSWSLNAKERTLRAEVDLPNDDIFLPGMYAYVSLRGKFADRLTVPAAAILTSGDQQFCFLYEEGKARKAAVQTGLRSGNLVEVLRRQVSADGQTRWETFTGQETLLTGNLFALSDGQTVEVRP